MHTQSSKPIDAIVAGIQALDLSPVKFRLSHPKGDKRWAPEYTEYVAAEYKKFLTLLVKHPEDRIVPSNEVDEFWHQHILDTMKYAQDCEAVFGYFLHHYPYFGLEGEEDALEQEQAANVSSSLYAREFGETAVAARPAWCFAAIEGKKAAWCFAAVEAKASAWCFAAKVAKKAAWCFAAVEAKNPAWCFAATEAKNAAWCFAAKEAQKPAWCFAAVEAKRAAWCFAAKEAKSAAWCFAAKETQKPAWCFAAVDAKKPAWCFAAVDAKKPAWCFAAVETKSAQAVVQ